MSRVQVRAEAQEGGERVENWSKTLKSSERDPMELLDKVRNRGSRALKALRNRKKGSKKMLPPI